MFRITEDPSSGSIYSAWLKITRMVLPSCTVNYTHAQWVRICCHNIDLVHVNGHDRIILVIFSQALYKAP